MSGVVVPKTAFKKGHAPLPGAGRKKGSLNKTTSVLKNAILQAGENVGFAPHYDKHTKQWRYGKGGLQGYLEWMACTDMKSYANLLGRVLPLQLTGEGGGPVQIISADMSPQDAANAYADMLKANPPPMIDVTPNPPTKVVGSLPRYKPAERLVEEA